MIRKTIRTGAPSNEVLRQALMALGQAMAQHLPEDLATEIANELLRIAHVEYSRSPGARVVIDQLSHAMAERIIRAGYRSAFRRRAQ